MSAITTAAAEPLALKPTSGLPSRRAPLGRVLLTLAFAALFCAVSFHASGGLQLKTLTHIEVFLIALAGILGASEATPLAGAGHRAGAAAEQLILAGLVTVAISMVVAVGLLLMGMRRSLSNQTA